MSDKTMEFRLPKGWRQAADSPDGVLLLGPSREGVRAFISAAFYADGQGGFKGAHDYIDRYQEPEVKVNATKAGPVEASSAGKLAARRFGVDKVDFVPPSSMDTKEVPVREEHVLLERKGGFYAFVLHASKVDFKKQRKAFQAVLDSFRPRP